MPNEIIPPAAPAPESSEMRDVRAALLRLQTEVSEGAQKNLASVLRALQQRANVTSNPAEWNRINTQLVQQLGLGSTAQVLDYLDGPFNAAMETSLKRLQFLSVEAGLPPYPANNTNIQVLQVAGRISGAVDGILSRIPAESFTKVCTMLGMQPQQAAHSIGDFVRGYLADSLAFFSSPNPMARGLTSNLQNIGAALHLDIAIRKSGIAPNAIDQATIKRWQDRYAQWRQLPAAARSNTRMPEIADVLTPEAAEAYQKTLASVSATPSTAPTSATESVQKRAQDSIRTFFQNVPTTEGRQTVEIFQNAGAARPLIIQEREVRVYKEGSVFFLTINQGEPIRLEMGLGRDATRVRLFNPDTNSQMNPDQVCITTSTGDRVTGSITLNSIVTYLNTHPGHNRLLIDPTITAAGALASRRAS